MKTGLFFTCTLLAVIMSVSCKDMPKAEEVWIRNGDRIVILVFESVEE